MVGAARVVGLLATVIQIILHTDSWKVEGCYKIKMGIFSPPALNLAGVILCGRRCFVLCPLALLSSFSFDGHQFLNFLQNLIEYPGQCNTMMMIK